MTTSEHLFTDVRAQFPDIGLAHIGEPAYDELSVNPMVCYYRLLVTYDGASDEDTQFLMSPPDGGVLQALLDAVTDEVRDDYERNPDSQYGYDVEIYHTGEDGDTQGDSPILSARYENHV